MKHFDENGKNKLNTRIWQHKKILYIYIYLWSFWIRAEYKCWLVTKRKKKQRRLIRQRHPVPIRFDLT